MAFTKIVGAGIHTLSNIHSHNVNSSGIITATKFVGPFDGTTGDFSGNVTIDGNLIVNGDTTTLNTTLREVELLRVDATSSTAAGIITQRGAGDILNLHDGGTAILSVKDGGNIIMGAGAGSVDPHAPLHIRTGTTGAITTLLKLHGPFTSNTGSEGTAIDFGTAADTSTGARIIGSREASGAKGALRFCTGRENDAGFNDGRMVIDETGTVGIGSTTPLSAMALDVVGSIRYSNQLRGAGGSAAEPSYAFYGDHDTGMYRGAGVNILSFATAGTQRLSIDADGQIGIGNIAPDTWSTGHGLTIGTSQATLWGVGDQINLSGNAYFNSGWKAAATKDGASQIEQALGNIDFKVSGSVTADSAITWINALRITKTGKVGIKTTSPTAQLSIGNVTGGYINATGIQVNRPHSLGLQNGVLVYTDIGFNATSSYRAAAFKAVGTGGNALGISTDQGSNGLGGTLNARIGFDGSGYFLNKVGIGTNNPLSLLHVHGTGGNGSGLLIRNAHDVIRQYFQDNNNDSDFIITYDGTGGAELTLHADGNLGLNQSNGDNVFIGTNTVVGHSRFSVSKSGSGITTAIGLSNGGGVGSRIMSSRALVLSADQDNNSGTAQSYIGFETDSTEKVRITSVGRVLLGHDTQQNDFHGPQTTTNRNPYIQLHGGNASSAAAALISWSASSGAYYSPVLYLGRSGSATKGTNGIIPASQTFGSIVFSGDDGTDFVKGAMITAESDGTPGNNDMPGRLEFHTTPSGAQVPEERMRISKSGSVGIGTNNPQCVLDIVKDITGGVNYVDIRNHASLAGAALRVRTQGSYNSPFYDAIVGASDAGGTIRMGAASNHDLLLLTNNDAKVTIKADGKVGIGTNNAGEKLDVDGAIRLRAGGNWTTYAARLMAALDATHTLRLEAYHNSSTPFEVIGTHADSGGSDPRIAIGKGGQPVVIGHTAPYHNYDATGTFTQFAVVTNTGSAGFHETAHFAGGSDSNDTGATLRIGHYGNDRGLYIKAGRQSSDRAVSYFGLRNSSNVDNNMLTLWDDGGFEKVGIASDTPTDRFDVRIRDNSNDEYQMSTRYRSGNNASGWTASGLALTGNAKNSSGNKHSVFINFSARHPDLNGNHGTSAYLVMSTPDAPSTYGTGQFDFYCRNNAAYSFKNDPQVPSNYQMDSLLRIKSNGHVSVRSGSFTVSAELNMHSSSEVAVDKFFDIGFSAANKYFRMRRTAGNDSGHSTFLSVNQSDEISGDFVDTSDGKLKKNIAAISDGAIEDIKKLRPVTFDWIADSKNNNVSGFIAQEIKEVLPNLVSGTEYDPTLNDPEKGTKGGIKSEGYSINSIGVTAHLTKALQEAIAKIEVLEAKVAALESS